MSYIYPYHWAQNVVQEFLEKYSRGTYIFAKMSGLTYKEVGEALIHAVRSGKSMKWQSIKRAIKNLNWLSNEEIGRLSPKLQEKYLTYVMWEAEDLTLDEEKGLKMS